MMFIALMTFTQNLWVEVLVNPGILFCYTLKTVDMHFGTWSDRKRFWSLYLVL